MNFYQTELNRIRSICFSNKWQIETVIAIRSFIDTNFEKELNLNLLSHLRYTSKFHLLRLFKRYYGLTPGQYLISRRIEESKNNLRKGMAVRDTCYSVGFGSPSSFSTLFKGKVGLTPTEFQKRATFAK
jgi:AraC-like DNA-binding protein